MKNCPQVKFVFAILAIVALAATVVYTARADSDDVVRITAKMTGFQENLPKLTSASGTFTATLAPDGKSLSFKETWTGLSGPAVQSHIHFGQPGVNGGIFVWLCGTTTNPNPDTDEPPCPTGTATATPITGTINMEDVLGVPTQNITAGDFAGLLKIIRAGDAYVNVHTAAFPSGEIRGQVHISHDEDDNGN